MEFVNELLAKIKWELIIASAIRIVLALAVAWIILGVLRRLLAKLEDILIKRQIAEGEPPNESAKRIQTLIRLIRQAVRLSIWGATALIVLAQMGVDIGPILAGAGILGLAVGFGAQNLVRDIITGFFMILENQVRVGDVAVINGTGGLVEKINFRTIVLRDLSGVVHIFPNGTISTVSNMTNDWSAYVFDIGVAYKENTDEVVAVIKDVCANLRKDDTVGRNIIEDAEIFGVDKLDDSAVVIKGRIKTKPIQQWAVGREFLRRVKLAFDEKGIEIPFPHMSVYVGSQSKPLDVMLKGQK